MSKMISSITVGVQMGDLQSEERVGPHITTLCKLLDQYCKGLYSKEVKEFALVLRIDGNLWHWDKEGCERLRRSFKEEYITIDIMMPKSRWQNQTATVIREYLMDHVEKALRLCVERLEKDKVKVDGAMFNEDLGKVREKYLQ